MQVRLDGVGAVVGDEVVGFGVGGAAGAAGEAAGAVRLGPVMTRLEVRRGHLAMLTATGRSSGLPRHTPVTAHSVDGRTYLWCPYGRRAQWYRNITDHPVVTVQSRGGARAMRAVGVDDVDEAAQAVAELRRFDEAFLRSYLGA